jgi:hypothetical protein
MLRQACQGGDYEEDEDEGGEDDDADGDQDHSLGEAALWYSRGGRGGD